jgi:hypothetical protein
MNLAKPMPAPEIDCPLCEGRGVTGYGEDQLGCSMCDGTGVQGEAAGPPTNQEDSGLTPVVGHASHSFVVGC